MFMSVSLELGRLLTKGDQGSKKWLRSYGPGGQQVHDDLTTNAGGARVANDALFGP